MVQTTIRNAGLDDLAKLLQEQHARKLDVVAPATAIRSQAGQIVLAGTDAELTDDGRPAVGTRPTTTVGWSPTRGRSWCAASAATTAGRGSPGPCCPTGTG